MNTYLIGLSWCDPEEVAAYVCAGFDDDPKCSTGLFVMADDEAAALAWANEACQWYLGYLFAGKKYRLEQLEIHCWVDADPKNSRWTHCLDFFQRVEVGEEPEFEKMTAEAYMNWCNKAARARGPL